MRLAAMVRGAGPAVVLLHGLFGAGRNFGALQRRLAARYQVVALDLRNHGDSPHAPGMGYPTQAADVAETLAALGIATCRLLGHSMGGKVAMRLALDAPAMVERLLVADIAPVAYHGAFALYARSMQQLQLAAELTRATAESALAAAVPDLGLRRFLLSNLQFGAAPQWRIGLAEISAGLSDILGWPAISAQFAGPALFVGGDRSDYIGADHHPAIRRLFPNARFATVPNAGHWIHADNFPAFAEMTEQFFA